MEYLTKLCLIFLCICICDCQQAPPIITFYNGEIPIVEGRRLTLGCSHSYNRRNVAYRWILSSQPKRGFYEHDSKITFVNIDRDDHIFVTCQVLSITGTLGVSRPVLVEAHYMDQPELHADNWDVRKSDSVHIRCKVNSQPDVDYVEILKDGNRVRLGSRLEILKVDKSDAGKYSCRAKSVFFTMKSREHELTVGGISTKAIHIMAYFGGVFFPLLIVIFVVMTTCRYFARRKAKRKLQMTSANSPTDSSNIENVLKEGDVYYVGRFNRTNDAIPPSYDEAINDSSILPPSYDEVTQNSDSSEWNANETNNSSS